LEDFIEELNICNVVPNSHDQLFMVKVDSFVIKDIKEDIFDIFDLKVLSTKEYYNQDKIKFGKKIIDLNYADAKKKLFKVFKKEVKKYIKNNLKD